jgi:hypothetical protein
MTVLFIIPVKKLLAKESDTLDGAKPAQDPGQYLRVFNWASGYGLSLIAY